MNHGCSSKCLRTFRAEETESTVFLTFSATPWNVCSTLSVTSLTFSLTPSISSASFRDSLNRVGNRRDLVGHFGFEGFEFFREGRPRVLHFFHDGLVLVFHSMFSCRAWTV